MGRTWLFAALFAGLAAACGPTGGYQRGLFQGYVVGATEEEITSKVGKPDSVDNADPKAPRWIYTKKTFDPDNQNQVDADPRHSPAGRARQAARQRRDFLRELTGPPLRAALS